MDVKPETGTATNTFPDTCIDPKAGTFPDIRFEQEAGIFHGTSAEPRASVAADAGIGQDARVERGSFRARHAGGSHGKPAHARGWRGLAAPCTLLVLLAALLAGGCVSPHGAVVADVDATSWHAPAVIDLANTDTTTLRDMDVFLRCNDLFAEDSLTVRIAVLTPDSLRCEEPFVLTVPHAHTPAAIARETVLPYRRRIRFARTGDYRITITPGRPVKGVEAVGINIVKSE